MSKVISRSAIYFLMGGVSLGLFAGYWFFSAGNQENQIIAVYGNGQVIRYKDVAEKLREPIGHLNRQAYELKKAAARKLILEKENISGRDEVVAAPPAREELKYRSSLKYRAQQAQKMHVAEIARREKLDRELDKVKISWKIANPDLQSVKVDTGNLPATGPRFAKNKLVVFTRSQCVGCETAELRLKELKEKYGDEFRIHYRLPVSESDSPLAMFSAQATYCAADQDQFTKFFELMSSPSIQSEADVRQAAVTTGLNIEKFNLCLSSGKMNTYIAADRDDARKAGVEQVPVFIFNDKFVSGIAPLEVLEEVLKF